MRGQVVLADTNVVSYIFSGKPLGADYELLLNEALTHISFVTAGEMLFGAEIAQWGAKRRHLLDAFLARYTVVGFEPGMERVYARIAAERRRAGRPLDWRDAWICAQALSLRIPLCTHDGDFAGVGGLEIVTLLSPMHVREPAVYIDYLATSAATRWQESHPMG